MCFTEVNAFSANCVDPDRMPRSGLDLHCFVRSFELVSDRILAIL